MDNNVLNLLLREYDQKRIRAELDLEKRKEPLLIRQKKKTQSQANPLSYLISYHR